jgi:hypothetical protein
MIVAATAEGIASKTMLKQPASCSASASRDARGRLGVAALRAVAAERRRGLRRQADVAHDRDAGARDRPRAGHRRRAAALELDRVAAASLTKRNAVCTACSSETS